MNSAMVFLAVLAILLVLYLLSAELAFGLMYRIGRRFPSRAAGIVYASLEWLSRRSRSFGRFYNGLWLLSYRLIVRGPLDGGWPPPPLSL